MGNKKLRNEKGQFMKGNSGFWIGKKRPNLVSTGARKTMFKKGFTPHNKYLEPIACNFCETLFQPRTGKNKFCSHACFTNSNKGKPTWNSGITYKDDARILAKEKSPSWQGGITKINWSMRHLQDYKHFRIKVLERDDYKCVECSSTENLTVDHIKPFSLFPELRLDINNGQTLCRPCHVKTPTWGGRVGTYKEVMGYGYKS